MSYTNIFFFLFLLSALAVGVALEDSDKVIIDDSLNKAILNINNITLSDSKINGTNIPNINGLFTVLENYIRFVGSFAIEIFRAGIHFGQDNPDYFEPSTLMYYVKLIVWLLIISLLIKPVGYGVIFLIMGVMFIYEKLKKGKSERITKPSLLTENLQEKKT